jgi:hypothetical protein
MQIARATDGVPAGITGEENAEAPTLASVQHDVAQANLYRLELIRTTMTLATGLFTFTVAFPVARDKSSAIIYPWLAQLSWIALGISICAGLYHMRMWERFHISYHDRDWKQGKRGAGKRLRKWITFRRRLTMVFQYLGFAVGVGAVGAFAVLNIAY